MITQPESEQPGAMSKGCIMMNRWPYDDGPAMQVAQPVLMVNGCHHPPGRCGPRVGTGYSLPCLLSMTTGVAQSSAGHIP